MPSKTPYDTYLRILTADFTDEQMTLIAMVERDIAERMIQSFEELLPGLPKVHVEDVVLFSGKGAYATR